MSRADAVAALGDALAQDWHDAHPHRWVVCAAVWHPSGPEYEWLTTWEEAQVETLRDVFFRRGFEEVTVFKSAVADIRRYEANPEPV